MFDLPSLMARLQELEKLSEDPNLWENQDKAKALMQEKTSLEKKREVFERLAGSYDDAITLLELGDELDDEEALAEGEKALSQAFKDLERQNLESLLSGEADNLDCFLEIHAGAGGTEAQDWAQMLLRMYARWAETRGYTLEWIQESPGEEAGIKSATLRLEGEKAYGWLKTECGVHRLVRISPFDANAKRHTSFASVGVYPVIDDNINVELEEKDLRVDTYRASGAGGQHVNTTDSAVRITHVPTGIVVQCQNDRSQHRNKAEALRMLKSRLYERELKRREEEAMAENAAKTDIGWGHQIRSYVLHPYQMIKDLRTQVETGNTSAVLDGNLDMFLEASLATKLK